MTEHIAITVIILAAGGLTYLLRAAPVLLFQHRTIDTTARPFRFLEYAAYAIIGGLISGSVVKSSMLLQLSSGLPWDSVARITVVLVTFLLAIKIKQPVVCLAMGLVLFFLLRSIG
jgi:branched-subunit amino acid transport protein